MASASPALSASWYANGRRAGSTIRVSALSWVFMADSLLERGRSGLPGVGATTSQQAPELGPHQADTTFPPTHTSPRQPTNGLNSDRHSGPSSSRPSHRHGLKRLTDSHRPPG